MATPRCELSPPLYILQNHETFYRTLMACDMKFPKRETMEQTVRRVGMYDIIIITPLLPAAPLADMLHIKSFKKTVKAASQHIAFSLFSLFLLSHLRTAFSHVFVRRMTSNGQLWWDRGCAAPPDNLLHGFTLRIATNTVGAISQSSCKQQSRYNWSQQMLSITRRTCLVGCAFASNPPC